MTALLTLYDRLTAALNKIAGPALPTLARFVFAATLLIYFWKSASTKLGDGVFGFLKPGIGAYGQMFPKALEAAGYNTSELSFFHWLIAVAGTWAEFILPLLIVIGLFTRLASLGMIGFVIVQSLTDLYGHGGIEHAATVGAWFDRLSDGAILDQRAFWMLALLTLVLKGAGPLSVDKILSIRRA
ncbi:DoxX family protein [Aestuariibius sp. HNIBRBA575]|uniref:DoxX family protein n=1 Tax=Aestuariibius sp. HNIBRBA575 TaxID=3233343 RepID=UPI0034A34B0E